MEQGERVSHERFTKYSGLYAGVICNPQSANYHKAMTITDPDKLGMFNPECYWDESELVVIE